VIEVPLSDDFDFHDYSPDVYLQDASDGHGACSKSTTSSRSDSTNTTAPFRNDYDLAMKNGTKAKNIGLSLRISDNDLAFPSAKFVLAGWLGKLVTDVSPINLQWHHINDRHDIHTA
jgi:hypothetical protein